jgi:MSHA biogenesis protein MshO
MGTRIRGFTLVELVTVILILGVMLIGVSSFIIFGTRIFVESSSVDQVIGQSRFAIERMTRELRNAVPNSVRLSDPNNNWQCVEFVPTEASTSYLDMPIFPDTPAAITGTAIIDNPAASQISTGQWALIYPLSDADVYDVNRGKRFQLTSRTLASHTLTLGFGTTAIRFAQASPRKRVYLATEAVSYCVERSGVTSNINRYANYGFLLNQPTPAAMLSTGTQALMAQDVVNDLTKGADLPIALTPSSLMTNAIVQLQPRFSVLGETFQYRHQVQVINVP